MVGKHNALTSSNITNSDGMAPQIRKRRVYPNSKGRIMLGHNGVFYYPALSGLGRFANRK